MMFNFPEIVPIEICMNAVQGCGSLGGGYTAASRDKNFSEIWVLKLRVYRCIIKMNFVHKNPEFC